jgi:glycosyltransferase involved in cell wall biosynthesis
MRAPTVLHFLGYDEDRGGVLTAIRLLARQGGANHVLVVNPGFAQRRDPRLPVQEGPAVTPEVISPRALWPTFCAAWVLRCQTLHEVSVVHGQSRAGTLVGLWLWLLGQRGVVISPHCYGRQRWFYRWAALCLGENWAWLSPAMKRYYDAGGDGWAACIPEPASDWDGVASRARSRNPGTKITLGGAGTLAPWKGWHLVLAALGQLAPAERARFCFVHIGDADSSASAIAYRDRLERETNELGLSAQVEWRGWQPDSSALLAEADVLLVPSFDEPMALAGLEALTAGVPLIVADSGGLNDVVTPGRNALVFHTGNAGDLANRLRELLATDFLARASISSADLRPLAASRVAAAWRERYAAVLGSEVNDVL